MKTKLFAIALCLICISAFGDINQQRAANIYTATSNGTVAAGCRSLIFIFSATFVGTVNGTAFNGNTDASLQIPVNAGDWLGPVKYTVTAGSVRIMEVR